MNRDEFLNRLKQDMLNDESLMPEIALSDLTQLLFGTPNVNIPDVEKELIGLRSQHGIDHIVAILEHKRIATIRFWLMKNKEVPLLEGEITND